MSVNTGSIIRKKLMGKSLPEKDIIKKWKIFTGDTVEVMRGKDKKKQGKVIKVLRKKNKLVVKGINVVCISLTSMLARLTLRRNATAREEPMIPASMATGTLSPQCTTRDLPWWIRQPSMPLFPCAAYLEARNQSQVEYHRQQEGKSGEENEHCHPETTTRVPKRKETQHCWYVP